MTRLMTILDDDMDFAKKLAKLMDIVLGSKKDPEITAALDKYLKGPHDTPESKLILYLMIRILEDSMDRTDTSDVMVLHQ